ncbi:MAG: pyridoxal phosphate-dependent aminotransferase family protein, partial [Oscillospiraceae bacterium]|nr:pyridoxal phosphate-dependent aminotransferase family protein [Oscillospiraceae bacterium]
SVPETAGRLVVTDGVFSMSGDIARLPDICALAKKYGARVMVDDAHGLGILGEGGRGTANHFGVEDQVDIITGTFSKSLVSLGGFAAANVTVVEYIRCNSRPYMFAASIPPAQIAVATAALDHLRAHPELPAHLKELTQYMRTKLKENGVKCIDNEVPIIPIYTYEPIPTLTMQKELYERGVYVNATIPPACAPGECLLRCSLMATLTKELIDEAVDVIAEVIHSHDL